MEFIDLKAQYSRLKDKIDANISSVINSAHFIHGEEVTELEEKLAEYVGRKHCITCGNGTDALQLSFMAYKIGYGDAVFCPDMTFIASIEPACMLGASPVFVDIEPDTYNISPVALEKAILRIIEKNEYKPKAVVAVDFLGNPANYEKINDICKKYNLILIEDAAQSMGADYKRKKCCSFGDIATTSFFPSKPLGCYGDGGAVFTDDDDIAAVIRSLCVHGKGSSKYDNIRIGLNSRLDTLQATILLAKLTVLSDEIIKRQAIAKHYNDELSDIVQIPYIDQNSISSYAQYAVITHTKEERNLLINALNKKSIPSLIYYPTPQHLLKVYNYNTEGVKYCNAEKYAECNLGLPFSPYLTKDDQNLVIETIREFYTK